MLSLRATKNAGLYDQARALGLEYSGDCSLVHGGTFYNPRDWKEFGYADAVRVTVDDGHVFVDVGCINRPDDMNDAWRWIGCDPSELSPDAFPFAEIEAAEAYCGVEDQGTGSSAVYKLSPDEDFFRFGDGWISMDDLEGFVMRKFVLSIAPAEVTE